MHLVQYVIRAVMLRVSPVTSLAVRHSCKGRKLCHGSLFSCALPIFLRLDSAFETGGG